MNITFFFFFYICYVITDGNVSYDKARDRVEYVYFIAIIFFILQRVRKSIRETPYQIFLCNIFILVFVVNCSQRCFRKQMVFETIFSYNQNSFEN